MIEKIEESLEYLKTTNPRHDIKSSASGKREHRLQKVLVANRGEIAKRFFLSLREEGIPSVAIVTEVDLGQSWYEQADEVVVIGEMRNYTNINVVIAAALLVKANAIYPGYGFLSEEAPFVEAIKEFALSYDCELFFMGPDSSIMNRVGDKLAARKLAREQGVPLFDGSESLPNAEKALIKAEEIGYPVIVKLSGGGGGKGMLPVFAKNDLHGAIESCQRTGRNLYSNDTFYLEKFIESPVHMEVQIFNGTAIGIRKCAVQRRNQKVVEESGESFLDSHTTLSMLAAAENMARISGYSEGAGAGTVEFLFDPESQKFGFLEMNARLQVEHPVTDLSVGIDLAKWQILYYDGREDEIPYELALKRRFVEKRHAIEARIYAEDPENDYAPAPGKIQELELPTFNGIRSDFGFKKGDLILPHYDPMIGKIIVEGATREEAITRLERALSELYVKGVITNINQLLKISRHPEFKSGKYTNRLLMDHKDLEVGYPNEGEVQLAAIFGALAENARYIQEETNQTFISGDLENKVQALRMQKLPSSYTIKIHSQAFDIELIQVSLEVFYVFLDGRFIGEVELLPRLEGNDDYLVRFGIQYYPIRIDRKPTFTLIRMPDNAGKIQYFKLNIIAQGAGEKVDPAGMVRSPFQSTFVAFGKDPQNKKNRLSEGTVVTEGDPVIIVSAMKMETTLFAPVSGKVKYLAEDGDLSRLEIGKTPDGLIIGKSINEGEILFIINEDSPAGEVKQEKSKKAEKPKRKKHPLDRIYDDSIIKLIKEKPDEILPVLMKLISSHFMGFLPNDKIVRRISDILNLLDSKVYQQCNTEDLQNAIASVITFYTNVKKIYSPVLHTNLSYFGELNQFMAHWEDDTYRPSYAFRMTLAELFKAYGVSDWAPKAGADNSLIKFAFFNILRAHGSCRSFSEVIRQLVEIVSYIKPPSKKVVSSLKGLIMQEQAERDNFLAVYTAKLLKELDGPQITSDVIPIISRKYIPEFKSHMTDIFNTFGSIKESELIAKIDASLKKPEKNLLPDSMPKWLFTEVEKNLEQLSKSYNIGRLYSPFDNVLIYLLSEIKGKKSRYLAISYVGDVKLDRDEAGNVVSSEGTEKACIRTTQIIRAYQHRKPYSNNWVEIFANDHAIPVDLGSNDSTVLNYNILARTGISVFRFFTEVEIERTTVHVDAEHPISGSVQRKSLLLNRRGGRLNLDLLCEEDARNPYAVDTLDPRDQRLFERDKWPIDIWVAESFDPGTAEEIKIPSIDEVEWENPKTRKREIKPVGGRIFTGELGKKPAMYYMKDSRISGGASGNLEGLKYVAATYISFRKQLPLYVWNDGAGANIKEGMVSLNRAAQGFMMNAILGGRFTRNTFDRYTNYSPDPVLRSMFKEVDSLDAYADIKNGEGFFIVGVGIGSSTGLDVYGSSQMAIQVMVDSEQSYRVLTGSNVIKSVTGEDLTNYEIGGARVMGKWTGTVDIIAQNKLHLLSYIRSVQEIFSSQKMLNSIQRTGEEEKEVKKSKYTDVMNYQVLKENVDNGFYIAMKEEFFGAGSAIGGFGKIGGRPVLIMGPRTDFGIRSFASITKAKELMVIAHKIGVNQILLFGENWYHETITEDDLALRARTDFIRLLTKNKGVRIHIITHRDGLHRVTINSSADATIYVDQEELSAQEYEVVRKTATFIVNSVSEGFDIAHQLINLLDPVPGNMVKVKVPTGKPTIPDDTSLPFNMVTDVIDKTFDSGSFLEFFEKINDPTQGPCLVTGMARLNGESVGIIADQPAIMGGAPDAPGTEKFRVFTELMEKNNIPLVMLSNAPGFVPGTKQERLRIQQIGAESLDVNVVSQVPVVSVVLNQNFGGRQIHAFSKYLRPGIVYLALKKSVMAVMGASAAFDLFLGPKYSELIEKGKTKEANDLKKNYLSEYNNKAAASTDAWGSGILDGLIEKVEDLRKHLIEGLGVARSRVKRIFKNELAGMTEIEKSTITFMQILDKNSIEYAVLENNDIEIVKSNKVFKQSEIIKIVESIFEKGFSNDLLDK